MSTVKKQQLQPVIEKIQELIPLAPSDWAEKVAILMGKSVSSVRQYATGAKGIRKDSPLIVYRYLKAIVAEREKEIKKEISK